MQIWTYGESQHRKLDQCGGCEVLLVTKKDKNKGLDPPCMNSTGPNKAKCSGWKFGGNPGFRLIVFRYFFVSFKSPAMEKRCSSSIKLQQLNLPLKWYPALVRQSLTSVSLCFLEHSRSGTAWRHHPLPPAAMCLSFFIHEVFAVRQSAGDPASAANSAHLLNNS